MCRENVSMINGFAFALLIIASLACALSFSAPFWIYYPSPRRHDVPKTEIEKFDQVVPEHPFKLASWRGLWAVCFKQPRLHLATDDSIVISRCIWFWQKDSSPWKSIPNWYLASEGLFVGAILLLLAALVVETLFACCHCCLRRCCAPSTVASFTVAAALMCVTSLALFGGYSLHEGEFTPESSGSGGQGQGGRLDWAFYVGIGGAVAALVAAILFYIDGCRLARIYSDYKPPTVTVG